MRPGEHQETLPSKYNVNIKHLTENIVDKCIRTRFKIDNGIKKIIHLIRTMHVIQTTLNTTKGQNHMKNNNIKNATSGKRITFSPHHILKHEDNSPTLLEVHLTRLNRPIFARHWFTSTPIKQFQPD